MADPLESCGKWFTPPEPSLTCLLDREIDRRKAANLSRDELNELTDKLLVDWYQHEATINMLLGRVRHLEVELVLAKGEPLTKEISATHLQMARDLLQDNLHCSNF